MSSIKKNNYLKRLTIALLACGLTSVVWAAEPVQAESLSEAITGGKPLVQFRARYEHVNQDGKLEDANAWTLRSLLGWQTKPFHDFSVTAQIINLTQLNHAFYDNDRGLGLASSYPTVQDPEITDINQLYVDYIGLPQTRVRLGRQIVQLDNVRFVGDVIFRQDSQVFDGISVVNTSLPDVELMAAHFERLRQTTTKLRDTSLDMLHVSWKFSPTESLAGYGYFQDQPVTGQATGFADNSNRILGMRLDGAHQVDAQWKVLYTAEYAKQDNYQNGDSRIDAHYSRLGGGANWNGWYARVDREVLSSKNGLYGFQTPLATLHPFQGWADMFTTTPKDGIKDTYLSLGGKVLDVSLSGEWHSFDADNDFATIGGTASHYGSELDLAAAYNLSKQLIGKMEYANFHEGDIYGTTAAASSRKRDTEKFWLTLIYTY